MESTLRNQIRKFLLIHLQEDDKHYSKLQKVVDQETNGKLHGRNIQKYLITLRDKLGIKPQKFLGRGWYGFAFLSTDNKTIKITSDRSEAIEARKWINKNPTHLPKIFNVFKFNVADYNEVYVIIKEHILQNQSFISKIENLENKLSKYLNDFDYDMSLKPGYTENEYPRNVSKLFTMFKEEEIHGDFVTKFINYLKSEMSNPPSDIIWYLSQIYYLYEEMISLGIASDDTGARNMGLRNKNLVYIDPGASDVEDDDWIKNEPYTATIKEQDRI